jgi:hypothetical protein
VTHKLRQRKLRHFAIEASNLAAHLSQACGESFFSPDDSVFTTA